LIPAPAAFTAGEPAVPIHSPRFRSGHTVPHCRCRSPASGRTSLLPSGGRACRGRLTA
jgi:hypothetical protein